MKCSCVASLYKTRRIYVKLKMLNNKIPRRIWNWLMMLLCLFHPLTRPLQSLTISYKTLWRNLWFPQSKTTLQFPWAISKSDYKFSIGLSSRLWLGHSNRFRCFPSNRWSVPVSSLTGWNSFCWISLYYYPHPRSMMLPPWNHLFPSKPSD